VVGTFTTIVLLGNVDVERAALEQAQIAAEEAYRQQALDYNLGHVVLAIWENDDADANDSKKKKEFKINGR